MMAFSLLFLVGGALAVLLLIFILAIILRR